jgi:hypothetical protein
MRRLSLLGNLSSHGSPTKSGGRDVFRTLDDNDSWSASLGSSAVFVKPQIERIGDNDEEWFSEAEQRSGDDSFSSNRSRSPLKKRGSGKSHGSGKSMLPQRQPSKEEVLQAMANTIGSFSQFEPSELSCEQPQQTQQLSRHSSSSPTKRKKVVASPKRNVSSDACLKFDFAKAQAIPSGSAMAVPMDAFLSEFENTDAEITDRDEESPNRLSRDRIKKKSSRDDPMRKQRRSERARKMEEAVECSESESDYGDLATPHDRMGAGRKQSMLGDLSDEDPDVLRYSGHNKEAAAAPAVSRSALSSRPHSSKKSSVQRSVSEVVEPDGKSSSPSKKSSTVRRSASEAVRPDSISSSSRKKSSGSKGKTEKPQPITRLAPSKKDYESDASRRRPKASRKPMSPVAADHHHRKKDREDDSDCSDDDSDSGQQRRAIPAQYQVKNNNGNMNHNGSQGLKSPGKEKRRPSMASARPEDVVNAIRRRYSVSSSVYNTDTEADDQSTMTDDSEVSRRSHRRSLDVWREKEKFKQQADSTFDSHTSEQKTNQNEKELQRQQMLDQSRRGPVRSISRQRSAHDAERSDSTRLVGQLLGEPETSNNDSSSDHEKTGGGRMRRQSLEVGYGQDSVYGSIDQIDRRLSTAAGNNYLPSGLNQAGRRGSQTCDRRGSQTGADSATDSMRNLMQTLAGSAKVESRKTTSKKKEKIAISPTEKTKEPGGGTVGTTSHDKSIDEILKARRLRGAKGRQKVNPEKEEAKKFNAMNLLTAGMLFNK